MRYAISTILFCSLLVVAGCVTPTSPPTSPETIPASPQQPTPEALSIVEGFVVRVIDGDTIKVDIDGRLYTVRYIGIDTPETVHPTIGEEPYGKEASEKNSELVEDKIVRLEKDVSDTDKYGRLLRYVYIGDLFVNAELVRLGLAEAVAYPPDTKYQDHLEELEAEAREVGRGLWAATVEQPVEEEEAALPGEEEIEEPAEEVVPPTEEEEVEAPIEEEEVVIPPAAEEEEPPPEEEEEIPIEEGSNVQITYIFYDGLVSRVESDEYVEIKNLGEAAQNLEGWVLRDISEGYPSLVFPSYILEPGDSVRVYTNEYHPEWGGFSFGYGKAVWNNTEPDTAALYNAQGQEVSRKSY